MQYSLYLDTIPSQNSSYHNTIFRTDVFPRYGVDTYSEFASKPPVSMIPSGKRFSMWNHPVGMRLVMPDSDISISAILCDADEYSYAYISPTNRWINKEIKEITFVGYQKYDYGETTDMLSIATAVPADYKAGYSNQRWYSGTVYAQMPDRDVATLMLQDADTYTLTFKRSWDDSVISSSNVAYGTWIKGVAYPSNIQSIESGIPEGKESRKVKNFQAGLWQNCRTGCRTTT